MAHVFEPASSGRSKCRGCGRAIAKGEIRFGERLANPFAEGEMTHWFHPLCAAYKRPEAMREALQASADVADHAALEAAVRGASASPRLPRIDGAERSPTGQAKCRHCREAIEKGAWRIRLVFHEEGTFSPGGFIHVACRQGYFETADMVEQVLHFSHALGDEERALLRSELLGG